jgi:hypothetical protein
MAGATTKLALPYPTVDDTVDVPRDVKALTDKLEASYSDQINAPIGWASLYRVGTLANWAASYGSVPMDGQDTAPIGPLTVDVAKGLITVTRDGIYSLSYWQYVDLTAPVTARIYPGVLKAAGNYQLLGDYSLQAGRQIGGLVSVTGGVLTLGGGKLMVAAVSYGTVPNLLP